MTFLFAITVLQELLNISKVKQEINHSFFSLISMIKHPGFNGRQQLFVRNAMFNDKLYAQREYLSTEL